HVSITNLSKYIVADLTSGKAEILQKPVFRGKPRVQTSPVKRVVLLCVFLLATALPLIALLRKKSNKV
ncbi:MAG TPA: hypothetical protein VGF13_21060, partial [Verrucomicrobiae bacterium]